MDLRMVDIPFVPMNAIPQDGIYLRGWSTVRHDELRSGIFFRDGDLLLAKITPCLENGKQGLAQGIPGGWGFATTEVFPLHCRNGLLPEFLALYLRLPSVRGTLIARMEGTTGRQRLPRSVLEQLPVVVPPVPEQLAIITVLSAIQRAKESTEAVVAAGSELRKSVMRHVFKFGPVSVEASADIKVSMTAFGLVPKHWRMARFEEAVAIREGQVDPTTPPFQDMPHVGPENIESETGRLTGVKTAGELGLISGKYPFGPEEVLYSKIRPYLCKVALPDFSGLCSADMYPVRPKTVDLIREFLYCVLLTPQFTEEAIALQSRTGIPKINRRELGSLLIPVPPIEEQRKIARIILVSDRKLRAAQQRAVTLAVLLQNLSSKLMFGEQHVVSAKSDTVEVAIR